MTCGGLIRLLRPPPDVAPIAAGEESVRQYRYWRMRILYASLIGYALFYFVRKNLPIAMPVMERELGITKTDLGLFLTLHGLVYGVSKFANGVLGDRTNPRYFMALGLVCSALMSIGFGLSGAVWGFGLFWLLNGWFQGMGFPPCARSLTHWFRPSERATWFSIWNTSHSIGAALVLVLCSFLVEINWRLCFFVPAAIALAGAAFLIERMRDRPESLGLCSMVEGDREESDRDFEEAGTFSQFVLRQVFLSPTIWFVCAANFFVYTVRYAMLDWGPTILSEMKHVRLQHAGWTVAAYEATGIAGMLVSGWMTDRVFGGRGGRACALYMLACAVCVWIFWKLPSGSPLAYTLVLCAAGFSIYGPQCLVGVMAANVATRRAAATAIGLTGFFGYLSGILSGWGLGKIAQTAGWDPVFRVLIGSALVAAVLFAICWNAGAGASRSRQLVEAGAEKTE